MRALPVESFTVVMATGVVAVAARDNGQPSIALFLAVLAGGGLALIVVWVAVALLSTGRGIVRAGKPVDRTCGLFGFVAAANVVAAQFDPARPVLITLLGAVALSAWGVVMTRLIVILPVAGPRCAPVRAAVGCSPWSRPSRWSSPPRGWPRRPPRHPPSSSPR